jgi:hypothetical protein
MVFLGRVFVLLLGANSPQDPGLDPRPYQPFFRRYCSDCHLEGTAKGGLDLGAVPTDLHDAEALRRWVRIYDRVRLGEMPPPKKEQALAGGGFKHGQHLALGGERDYPLSNLFVSMLQRLGIEASTFGTGTATMKGLEFA